MPCINPPSRKEPPLIELTDEMRVALSNALTDRVPVVMAYTDAEGQPHLSYRGTVQVFSGDQLGLWARNPEGGLPGAVGTQQRVALLYRNPETRLSWQFLGRARVTDDEQARAQIFENSPEAERNRDPERKGKALLVDVDQVIAGGQVLMSR